MNLVLIRDAYLQVLEKTWQGFEVLDSDLVDLLISECDSSYNVNHSRPMMVASSTCPTSRHTPFTVLAFEVPHRPSSLPIEIKDSGLSLYQPIPTIKSSPDCSSDERFLFNHYVNHVATIMMPYEHPRNPWKNHYPAVALELMSLRQSSLYYALVANASFNVARLLDKDRSYIQLGWKYSGIAIQALVGVLGKDDLDFSATMASIMTLMFAEVRMTLRIFCISKSFTD